MFHEIGTFWKIHLHGQPHTISNHCQEYNRLQGHTKANGRNSMQISYHPGIQSRPDNRCRAGDHLARNLCSENIADKRREMK